MILRFNNGPRLLKSTFEINTTPPEPIEVLFNFALKHSVNEDKTKIQVLLSMTAGDEQGPFSVEISTETIFDIVKKTKGNDIVKAVFTEAGPVIFPVVNEYFTDLIRKARVPLQDLPPIDFQAFYKQNKSNLNTGSEQ